MASSWFRCIGWFSTLYIYISYWMEIRYMIWSNITWYKWCKIIHENFVAKTMNPSFVCVSTVICCTPFVCPGIWPFAGPWSWLWFLPWCRTHVLLFGSLGDQNFHENQMEGKRNWMEKSNSVKSTTRVGSNSNWGLFLGSNKQSKMIKPKFGLMTFSFEMIKTIQLCSSKQCDLYFVIPSWHWSFPFSCPFKSP